MDRLYALITVMEENSCCLPYSVLANQEAVAQKCLALQDQQRRCVWEFEKHE